MVLSIATKFQCQYNDLKVFLMFFVMWLTVLIFIVVYLNSLYLEYNTPFIFLLLFLLHIQIAAR
jgi:hypothetical protein